ncbi:MAG: hemerythrin domain-containing protein [Nocardioidaceae bacterium]
MSTLIEALEAEHHVIDEGIERFAAAVAAGTTNQDVLAETFALLRRHIYAEEEFLFPPLRDAGLVMPILVMLREHGEMWHLMEDLEALVTSGAQAAEVTAACKTLLALLEQHNLKEEPIIYPQADVTLDPAVSNQIEEFLASGTMPAGWVCQTA